MTAEGLEVLLEGLIPEIAYSGEKGVSVTSLLRIVRKYHHISLGSNGDTYEDGIDREDAADDVHLERTFSEAEMTSARWAWDWLRTRPQILINGHKRWNRLELSEILALPEQPEQDATDPALLALDDDDGAGDTSAKGTAAKRKSGRNAVPKKLTVRPRIHPSEDLVWQTLARHGVDYKRIPVLEWKCLLGIASVRGEGILQSDLRKLVDQDKRSLPKRTDSLAKKGYIAKRTVVANKMKTSKLWLIDFAPPVPEDDKSGLDFSQECLAKGLEPVPWHTRWTCDNVDVEAHARTVVGIVKAWGVIRYCDLRSKMNVGGKSSQMKTLAKSSQRFVDMGVLKYTAAAFPGSRKIFKDCLKFIRDPRDEEWEKFLATGKKTSQYSDASRHREPKGNALALYGKSGQADASNGKRAMAIRIFPGWEPEKPLFQNVFEVVESAGPEGASNPQVSVATVGYSFRRYMASHLTKLAETQQPPHLKKFQVVSKLVRAGKTSAYMFSVPEPDAMAIQPGNHVTDTTNSSTAAPGDAYGFGATRAKAFPKAKALSISDICASMRKQSPLSRRKGRMINLAEREERTLSRSATLDSARPTPTPAPVRLSEQQSPAQQSPASTNPRTRSHDEIQTPEPSFSAEPGTDAQEVEPAPPTTPPPVMGPPGAFIGEPGSLHPRRRGKRRPTQSAVIVIRSERLKDPSFLDRPAAPSEDTSQHPLEDDGSFTVRYKASTGTLQLDRESCSLVYRYADNTSDQESLTIRIEDVYDGPSVQDIPNSTDCGLFTVAKSNEDGSPPLTHVFLFTASEENERKAAEIQAGAAELKSAMTTSATAPDEPLASLEAAEDAPTAAPASAKTQKRGGAKGRGRKGRVSGAGGKVWKCEKCGGTWKNDNGLSYHQTKAQVPCNPDFDPASLVERARKRRRLTPVPPPPVAVSEAEEEEAPDSRPREMRRAQKPAKVPAGQLSAVRSALRPRAQLLFRGLGSGPALQERSLCTPTPKVGSPLVGWTKQLTPSMLESQTGSPMVSQPPRYHQPGLISNNNILVTGSASVMAMQAGPHQAQSLQTSGRLAPSQAGIFVLNPGLETHSRSHQPSRFVVDSTRPATPVYDSGSGIQNGVAAIVLSPEVSRAPQYEEDYSMAMEAPAYPELPGEENEPAGNAVGGSFGASKSGVEATESAGQVRYPFRPSTTYDLVTSEPKRRTAQSVDIILHLLDNNEGVFPGEKALYFAVLKIYLREFRTEMPPGWKNFHAALKQLTTRKIAATHTSMLRTEKGKSDMCRLLVRNGVDPTGPIANAMKQKMRDVFPSLYIPPPFDLEPNELAKLEEFSTKAERSKVGDGKDGGQEKPPNKNGLKFRSRRRIDEVEVFKAPYYTQGWYNGDGQEGVEDGNGSLQIGDSEYGLSPESRKRSVPEDFQGSPSAKRPKESRQPADSESPFPDSTPDTQDRAGQDEVWFPASSRRRKLRRSVRVNALPAIPGTPVVEPKSVFEAIKTYGLLPTKAHQRKVYETGGFGAKKVGKLPSEVGRVKNPGLSSLPEWFYKNVPRVEEPVATDFRFLAPNTGLYDACEDLGEGVASNANVTGEASSLAAVQPQAGTPHGPKMFEFVPAQVLSDEGRGVWTCPTLKEFEQKLDTSLKMQGWMPDSAEFLEQNLPTSAEDMSKKVRGQPWRTDNWLDQDYAKFFVAVQRCKMWEHSPSGALTFLLGGTTAPNYHFINLSPPECKVNMKPIKGRFAEERQFDLETLPYGYLDDDDDDVLYPSTMPKPTAVKTPRSKMGPPRQLKRQRIAKVTEKKMGMTRGATFSLSLEATKTARELNSFPRTVQDFLRPPGGDNTDDELDWTSENVRLTGFVVVTTLLGGVDRVVDWGLLLRLFPEMTISQLRHSWCALKKDRQSTIVNLTNKFRRAFLKAYANNELPPLDFNNTLAYDWVGLIRWATKLDGSQRESIPSSRKQLTDEYLLDDCRYENREWRESYYHLQRSVFNRFQDASSECLALPADKVSATDSDMDMVVALSWTRSLCVTPIAAYPTESVIKRRESLFPKLRPAEVTDLILRSIDELQRDGVISRSTSKWSNGRRWRFNNRVPDTLEKIAQADKLTKAVDFKRKLDEAFRAGQKQRVTYVTNDGMMLAILNLQATGRVAIETTGQPNVPMGHEPGNYETRKYTKKYLHFRLDIVPTESYIYNDDPYLVSMRERLLTAEAPSTGPCGAIPVWCDVFGKVDATRWFKYLSAVLLTIASRGAMRADEMVKTLKPTIMLFEAELLLDWAERMGLLEVQIEGTAPTAKEWWWWALEAQRERLEMADQLTKGNEAVEVEEDGDVLMGE